MNRLAQARALAAAFLLSLVPVIAADSARIAGAAPRVCYRDLAAPAPPMCAAPKAEARLR